MNKILKTALAAVTLIAGAQAFAQVTFYDRENFEGQSFGTTTRVDNFQRRGFNDRASSVIVLNDRWEVCEDSRFNGRCVVLRPGRYPSLAAMGLNDRISSTRVISMNMRVSDDRYAPMPQPVYDNHRRGQERLYTANVTNVRAVVGPPEKRCWMEKEQVVQQQRSQPNVGGALIGGLLGGVLGHQVGGGSGKDLATVAGAVGGAALGANVNRNGGGQVTSTQDVQRCETTQSTAKPEFWDVTYNFRGVDHHVQMTAPPAATITVNEQGEPRA